MEEAREFATLKNYKSIELSKSFITDHEYALRYHLKQIDNAIEKFDVAYTYLRSARKVSEVTEEIRDRVWEELKNLADAIYRIVQTLIPSTSSRREESNRSFTRERGRHLSGLLSLDTDEGKTLNDLRNRFVHYDEDFDDWYLSKNKETTNPKELLLITRKIFFDETELNIDNQGIQMCYDLKSGAIHFFDKKVLDS